MELGEGYFVKLPVWGCSIDMSQNVSNFGIITDGVAFFFGGGGGGGGQILALRYRDR